MKRIGLIGGMTWQSSHVYYQLLNEQTRTLLGASHSCDCVMVSVDFAKIEKLTFAGDWDGIGKMMAECAKQLQAAEADLIILCTNTIHLVRDAIEASTNIPFLHIADATGKTIHKQGLKKVALLGTRFTMEKDFYTRILKEGYGIEAIIPEKTEREVLQKMIYGEMVQGWFTESARQDCLRIIGEMERKGAEGVILGCTELPILLAEADLNLPRFNTTEIHAHAAIEMALSGS